MRTNDLRKILSSVLGLKILTITTVALLIIVVGLFYVIRPWKSKQNVITQTPTKANTSKNGVDTQVNSPATPSPTQSSPPTPTAASTQPSTNSSKLQAAENAYACGQYQETSRNALYSAEQSIMTDQNKSIGAAWQQSFPSEQERVTYINQITTMANTALTNAYNTYVNSFNSPVSPCSPDASKPILGNLLN
jgi:hypothetical protein